MSLKDILSWFLGLVALVLYPQRRVGNSSRSDSNRPNLSNPEQKSGLREKNFDRDADERRSTQASHISLLEEEIAKLQSSLGRATQESTHYEQEYVRFKQLYKDQRESKEAIDQQLQRVEEEYASLRSHYQLQNCMEKKDIVQGLEDLNVKIRALSQAISKKLIKDIRAKGGSVASMSTFDAFNYPQLESFFQAKGEGHSTHSSLVKSREGAGRGLVNFFDFAIRTSLCALLVELVFKPFCPPVNQSAPGCACLDIVYHEVQKQESQYMTGQWRSITFKSACELEGPEALDERLNTISRDILRISLDPLVTHFLGQNVEDELSLYAVRCNQLVRMAWEWDSKLKREVIMIGEFEQIAFGHCARFDSTSMEELDPKAGSVPPKCILGTVGLGLVLRQAVGEGRLPDETIVCKAKVVTDSFYGQN